MEQSNRGPTLAAAARVAEKLATCGLGGLAGVTADAMVGVTARARMFGPGATPQRAAEAVRDFAVAYGLAIAVHDLEIVGGFAWEVVAHGLVDGVPVKVWAHLREPVPMYALGLAPLPEGGLIDAATAEAIERENRLHDLTDVDCGEQDEDQASAPAGVR